MAETFLLPIQYKGTDKEIECTFKIMGYTYKISTIIQDIEVHFEPDEEGMFRASIIHQDDQKAAVDPALLNIIAQQLHFYLK